MTDSKNSQIASDCSSIWEVGLVFLRLGLTSFGGPVAHLGYFHEEFVRRRGWLTARSYADLVALCQVLPGPASSQVGMAVGLLRAGYPGALFAWLGFTLPSALILTLLALGLDKYSATVPAGMLHGLKIAAVAVVAQAVWGMARSLCSGVPRLSVMVLAASVALWFSAVWAQLVVVVMAGVLGAWCFKPEATQESAVLPTPIGRRAGVLWLIAFLVLLLGLPLWLLIAPNALLEVIAAFYRSGSLVFGGGHVVLPWLQNEVVTTHFWVNHETFLAGYGAAQAVPGPLFTFAAFLGASMHSPVSGWVGAVVCLLALFVPSFLLVAGALPFWQQLRHQRRMQAALMGINAAVVGLLLAALYQPLWTSAITQPRDFVLGLLAFSALVFWRFPPWLVVVLSAKAGWFRL